MLFLWVFHSQSNAQHGLLFISVQVQVLRPRHQVVQGRTSPSRSSSPNPYSIDGETEIQRRADSGLGLGLLTPRQGLCPPHTLSEPGAFWAWWEGREEGLCLGGFAGYVAS